MAMVAFTELTIRNLKPGSYFDAKTPAFGIRVGKNRKTWIVIRGQKRVRTLIGHYPALPLAGARKKALVLLGTPLDQQTVSTFAEGRELYMRTHCAQHQRERIRDAMAWQTADMQVDDRSMWQTGRELLVAQLPQGLFEG